MPRTVSWLLACVCCTVLGCSSPRNALPNVARLYKQAALIEARNPVIVIHGLLGARLEQRSTKKTVWGAFTAKGIDPEAPAGARAMALPMVIPKSAASYDPKAGDVIATGPLEKLEVGLLFQVFSVEVYANILRVLGAGGFTDKVVADRASPRYSDDHFTCFSFFYDWRRDNVENAIALGRFIAAARRQIARAAPRHAARLRAEGDELGARRVERWLARGYRFDVVAHSMGGLIARYFLRFGATDLPQDGSLPKVTWKGTEEIDRLVVVATPSFGSIEAFERLIEGFQPGAFLPFYAPEILGTMPALYQLLPRPRHKPLVDRRGRRTDVDLLDPAVWRKNGWGLAREGSETKLAWLLPELPADERRPRALAYQAWCLDRARAFAAALDQYPEDTCPARVYLFAADTEDTLTRARLVAEKGRLVPHFAGYPDLRSPGDGTVPRYSATADEREGHPYSPWLLSPVPWANVTFIADDHVGLTQNPHFANNVLFLLLEQRPRPVSPRVPGEASARSRPGR